MGTALSPLTKRLITLRTLLSRFLNPAVLSRIFGRIFRRVVHWITLIRCKLYCRRKGIDEEQKDGATRRDNATTSNDTDTHSFKQPDLTYTIMRNGETVSLNEAALSLYPFSANGIRSSRSSVRSRQSQTRDPSATRSSRHTPSINDFASQYSRHSHSVVTYPPSACESDVGIEHIPVDQDRIRRHLRNPQRQFSISLPDLQHGQERPHLPPINSNVQWNPALYNHTVQSPSPAVDVVSPSPTGARSPLNDGEGDSRPWDNSHEWNTPNRVDSPTPSINIEPMSPIEEVGSPRSEYKDTSFRVPSPSPSSAGRSSPASHLSGSNNNKSVARFSPDIVDIPELEDMQIYPVMAEVSRRYERRAMIKNQHYYLVVSPVTTVYETPSIPAGWVKYVHPEGAAYYHNPKKNIYTDSDINDPAIYLRLMEDVLKLEQATKYLGKSLPEGCLLMIDVAYKRKDENYDGSIMFVTEYYYVDLVERVIFWVQEYNTQFMDASWDIKGPKSFQHLGNEIKAQFWFFISLYPSALCLTVEMVCELRDLVLYFIGDHTTSPFSTAPYTMDVMIQLLSLTESMEKNVGSAHLGTVSLFARHMYIFWHNRFNNCFGESFARIERNFSIHGDQIFKQTWLVKSLSPILFSAPDIHLRNLQNMWVDGLMHKTVWEESIKKLNEEWQEFVFFATVMLTSNVGVLAIQSVDREEAIRSSTQIASYLSVVMNTGSIILGLLLMRQNRTKNRETSDDVRAFLTRQNHPMLGLETLAILYSLPYALLMWGVVAFLVSFCCIFFNGTSSETRGFVGSLAAAVAILIVWCIATSWEGRTEKEDPDRRLETPQAEPFELVYDPPPKLKDTILHVITNCIPHLSIPHDILLKFTSPKLSTDSGNTTV